MPQNDFDNMKEFLNSLNESIIENDNKKSRISFSNLKKKKNVW